MNLPIKHPDFDHIEIIDVEWRAGRDTVGIVATRDTILDRWKAYIGPVRYVAFPEDVSNELALNLISGGKDEAVDAIQIARHGAKLSKDEACVFFPHLDPEKFTY